VKLEAMDATHVRFTEGVGAAAIEAVLEIDGRNPNVARSSERTSRTQKAFDLASRRHFDLTLHSRVQLAACLDPKDELHLARVLDFSGNGIATQHEEDAVTLRRRPPPAPAPPPPPGFTVLADAQAPSKMRLGRRDVVWASWLGTLPATHALRAVARSGGPVRELATGLSNVLGLALHGDHLYFAEAGARRLARLPLAGGAIETVIPDVAASQVAVARDLIAWVDFGGSVYARHLKGGTPLKLFGVDDTIQIAGLVTDGATVWVATRPIGLGRTGNIVGLSARGRAPRVLARSTLCGQLTRAGGALFWPSCEGELWRVRPGRPAKVIARDRPGVESIIMVGRTIVFVRGLGRGEILGLPAGGGAPRMLLSGRFFPTRLAADEIEPHTVYAMDVGFSNQVPQGRIGRISLAPQKR
jgi:hypothetical protein